MFCQFLLYSKVSQSHIYINYFSHIIFHPVTSEMIRYIGPCAIQRDLIACPIQMQAFSLTNPKLPIHPTPPASTLADMNLPYMSMIFSVLLIDHLCHILDSTCDSYVVCLSLSDLLHSVRESLVPSMLQQVALLCSFLWLSSIPHLPNPIICQWTFGLIPCFGYCE